MPHTPASGKNRASRFGAGLPALLYQGGVSYECKAENLSRTGCLLAGVKEQGSGPARVVIRSAAGDLKFESPVTVVRSDPEPDGAWIIGVEFLPVAEKELQILERLVSRVVEGIAPAPFESLPHDATPAQIRAALEQIAIPHRIALANRASARERGMMLHDPSPQVLESLARNQGLSLHEIKALARITHLLPTTLEILAANSRFKQDEEFNVILASHPRVTVAIAENVIPRLSDHGVKRVLQRSGLPVQVKNKLANPLTRRQLRRR